MVKQLTSEISRQIGQKAVGITNTFTVGGTDYTSYLVENWSISTDRKFGAMSATFTLDNNDSRFITGGSNEIKVGNIVSFTQKYTGDSTTFSKFYGVVKNRNIIKSPGRKSGNESVNKSTGSGKNGEGDKKISFFRAIQSL